MIQRNWRVLIGTMVLVGWGSAVCVAEVQVGEPVPDFTLTDVRGEARTLASERGQFVVLEWFNPDCPFVRKHYGSQNMQQLQQAYTQRDVTWWSIDSSAPGQQGHLTAAQAEEWMQQQGVGSSAVLLDPDGAVGRLYGAKTTPHLFIINPEGTLVYAGAIDSIASAERADIAEATNYVQQALDDALEGRPVAVSSTKPYGCSVKYR